MQTIDFLALALAFRGPRIEGVTVLVHRIGMGLRSRDTNIFELNLTTATERAPRPADGRPD